MTNKFLNLINKMFKYKKKFMMNKIPSKIFFYMLQI